MLEALEIPVARPWPPWPWEQRQRLALSLAATSTETETLLPAASLLVKGEGGGYEERSHALHRHASRQVQLKYDDQVPRGT